MSNRGVKKSCCSNLRRASVVKYLKTFGSFLPVSGCPCPARVLVLSLEEAVEVDDRVGQDDYFSGFRYTHVSGHNVKHNRRRNVSCTKRKNILYHQIQQAKIALFLYSCVDFDLLKAGVPWIEHLQDCRSMYVIHTIIFFLFLQLMPENTAF